MLHMKCEMAVAIPHLQPILETQWRFFPHLPHSVDYRRFDCLRGGGGRRGRPGLGLGHHVLVPDHDEDSAGDVAFFSASTTWTWAGVWPS